MGGLDLTKLQTPAVSGKGKANKKTWNWTGIFNKDIRIGSDKLSDRIKEAFYLELYTMVSSGVELGADRTGTEQR